MKTIAKRHCLLVFCIILSTLSSDQIQYAEAVQLSQNLKHRNLLRQGQRSLVKEQFLEFPQSPTPSSEEEAAAEPQTNSFVGESSQNFEVSELSVDARIGVDLKDEKKLRVNLESEDDALFVGTLYVGAPHS